jgi:hypothetical protein
MTIWPVVTFPEANRRRIASPWVSSWVSWCVIVAVVMMMRVLTRCAAQPQLLAPGSPEHPQGDGDNQDRRCHLKIGLCNGAVVSAAEIHAD